MIVLEIGFHKLLFPDSVNVAGLLQTLNKGVSCEHYEGSRRVVLKEDKHLTLSMRVVRKGTPVVHEREDGTEEPVDMTGRRRPSKQLRLRAPQAIIPPPAEERALL